jgi:hypothetical protein
MPGHKLHTTAPHLGHVAPLLELPGARTKQEEHALENDANELGRVAVAAELGEQGIVNLQQVLPGPLEQGPGEQELLARLVIQELDVCVGW